MNILQSIGITPEQIKRWVVKVEQPLNKSQIECLSKAEKAYKRKVGSKWGTLDIPFKSGSKEYKNAWKKLKRQQQKASRL